MMMMMMMIKDSCHTDEDRGYDYHGDGVGSYNIKTTLMMMMVVVIMMKKVMEKRRTTTRMLKFQLPEQP